MALPRQRRAILLVSDGSDEQIVGGVSIGRAEQRGTDEYQGRSPRSDYHWRDTTERFSAGYSKY